MNGLDRELHEVECMDRRSGKDRRASYDDMLIHANKRSGNDRRQGIARREAKRFQVKTFTFVKLWSESDEDIGQLLDISHRGLSFRYLLNGEELRNFSELSILLSDGDFAVAGIPFRTLSDISMNNGSSGSTPIVFRRAGVQFKGLTSYQKKGLHYFLQNHILGQV